MLTKALRFTLLGAMTLPLMFSQNDSARITGTVTDASGAVIPSASITVKNEKTGQERKVRRTSTVFTCFRNCSLRSIP